MGEVGSPNAASLSKASLCSGTRAVHTPSGVIMEKGDSAFSLPALLLLLKNPNVQFQLLNLRKVLL